MFTMRKMTVTASIESSSFRMSMMIKMFKKNQQEYFHVNLDLRLITKKQNFVSLTNTISFMSQQQRGGRRVFGSTFFFSKNVEHAKIILMIVVVACVLSKMIMMVKAFKPFGVEVRDTKDAYHVIINMDSLQSSSSSSKKLRVDSDTQQIVSKFKKVMTPQDEQLIATQYIQFAEQVNQVSVNMHMDIYVQRVQPIISNLGIVYNDESSTIDFVSSISNYSQRSLNPFQQMLHKKPLLSNNNYWRLSEISH